MRMVRVTAPLSPYDNGDRIIDRLLSPQERDDLYRDLAEMARLRRKAESESANMTIGSNL